MLNVFSQLVNSANNNLTGTRCKLVGTPYEVIGTINDAELARVHQYLDDEELKHSPVEITLLAKYIHAPYDLHIGSELKCIKTGWSYDIRNVDVPVRLENEDYVHCIAVTITR